MIRRLPGWAVWVCVVLAIFFFGTSLGYLSLRYNIALPFFQPKTGSKIEEKPVVSVSPSASSSPTAPPVQSCNTGKRRCRDKTLEYCNDKERWETETVCPETCMVDRCFDATVEENIPLGYSDDRYPVITFQSQAKTKDASASSYWPLREGTNTQMVGFSRMGLNEQGWGSYKLQITVGKQTAFYEQPAIPVQFAKNVGWGYWSPFDNTNMILYVTPLGMHRDASRRDFISAHGLITLDRGKLPAFSELRRNVFTPLSSGYPEYPLLPKMLYAGNNPANVITLRMQMAGCDVSNNTPCTPSPAPFHLSWRTSVTDAYISTPVYTGPAKRVAYDAVTIDPKDDVLTPYVADRATLCRVESANSQSYVHQGSREDWYYAPDIGPVIIMSRSFVSPKTDPCGFDVLREPITIETTDTYAYAITMSTTGYNPSFFSQKICTIETTESRSCGSLCEETRRCDKSEFWSRWQKKAPRSTTQ